MVILFQMIKIEILKTNLSFLASLVIHNLIMNRSVLFHRENKCEWRYVGIWADMLDSCILAIEIVNLSDYLILFKEYDNQLQILQDNLRLRNLYNQHIAFNEKEEILKMEEKIKKNISDLPEQLALLVYNQKDDCLMKIEYKDYELNYSVI